MSILFLEKKPTCQLYDNDNKKMDNNPISTFFTKLDDRLLTFVFERFYTHTHARAR